jgi:activating signal cointegrator 1
MTTQIIKAISLHQPWATLITVGLKKHETRSWATSYNGPLLICAAKKTSREQKLYHQYFLNKYQQILTETDNYVGWDDLPKGCAIALVELSDCITMTQAFIKEQPQTELDTGDWRVGRFAWKLHNIRRIVPPMPITGKQGLFNAEVSLPEKLEPILATTYD